MKTYTKTHKTEKALRDHLGKIRKRGGNAKVDGKTINYKFDKGGSLDEIEYLMSKIDALIPESKYPILNKSAKTRPYDFMIDSRVIIKNKKEIYKVVRELAKLKPE